MKTIGQLTLKVEGKPKFDVLIEVDNTSIQQLGKVNQILEQSGYKDFQILKSVFFMVDKLILKEHIKD